MLIQLAIIALIGGALYFLAGRAPVIAPTVKAIIKWVILAVTVLALLDAFTGRHYLGRLG